MRPGRGPFLAPIDLWGPLIRPTATEYADRVSPVIRLDLIAKDFSSSKRFEHGVRGGECPTGPGASENRSSEEKRRHRMSTARTSRRRYCLRPCACPAMARLFSDVTSSEAGGARGPRRPSERRSRRAARDKNGPARSEGHAAGPWASLRPPSCEDDAPDDASETQRRGRGVLQPDSCGDVVDVQPISLGGDRSDQWARVYTAILFSWVCLQR